MYLVYVMICGGQPMGKSVFPVPNRSGSDPIRIEDLVCAGPELLVNSETFYPTALEAPELDNLTDR